MQAILERLIVSTGCGTAAGHFSYKRPLTHRPRNGASLDVAACLKSHRKQYSCTCASSISNNMPLFSTLRHMACVCAGMATATTEPGDIKAKHLGALPALPPVHCHHAHAGQRVQAIQIKSSQACAAHKPLQEWQGKATLRTAVQDSAAPAVQETKCLAQYPPLCNSKRIKQDNRKAFNSTCKGTLTESLGLASENATIQLRTYARFKHEEGCIK